MGGQQWHNTGNGRGRGGGGCSRGGGGCCLDMINTKRGRIQVSLIFVVAIYHLKRSRGLETLILFVVVD